MNKTDVKILLTYYNTCIIRALITSEENIITQYRVKNNNYIILETVFVIIAVCV